MDIKAGSLFANRFRLLERIPGGNRTQVWRVEDAKKGNAVFALKLFESDKELDPVIVQLLTNEFLSMSLKHTNLLMPASFAASGSVPYLVLPYMEKGSLRGLLQRSPAGGRVGEKQIVPFLAQIASGLAVLHKNNFVHQDIAPENIFLGEGGVFLLGDFGISRILHNTLSHEVGPNKIFHIAYASPERFISRSANPPDDIFSVGVVLVEMAMGKVPFDGQGGKPLLEEQEPRTYLDLNFSDEFIEIVQSCLQRNPDKRPTAAELEKWALSFTPLSPDELRAARAEKARKEKEAEEAKARRAEEIKKQTELQRKSKEDVDRRIREAGEKKAAKTKPQKTLADYVPGAAAELAAEKEQRAREEAARSEQEQKAREEAERKLREATERRIREETEKKVRQETERALREEAERRAREEKERRAREEAERKAREEAERQQRRAFEEQLKKELDSKLQEELSRIRSAAETQLQEAERLSQELAEQRARAEAERKHLAEEQQRLREEAERNAREESERRAREEAERRAREEAERQAREEAERQAHEEAERHAREEAERQAREEAERRAREEAERRAREEAERQAREEAERQAREEAEHQAREEAERQAREEAERQAREEAERQAREEAERHAREEAERQARELAEQRAREDAERQAREEADRKARELAEQRAREDAGRAEREAAEKRAQEEAERAEREAEERNEAQSAMRRAREELARLEKEEAERRAREAESIRVREEADMRLREETERRIREEMEKKIREEAEARARVEMEKRLHEETERLLREEAERKAREEAERTAREEAERKAREEAERTAREEAERKAREEAERTAREEAERWAREEAEKRVREEAEKKAKEEAERLMREDIERRAREEAERIAREETERRLRAELEKRDAEERERRVREEAERRKREDEERRAGEEQARRLREEIEQSIRSELEQRFSAELSRVRNETEERALREAQQREKEHAELVAREAAEKERLAQEARRAQAEAERLARETERLAREEVERARREEELRAAIAETEQRIREELEARLRDESLRRAKLEEVRSASPLATGALPEDLVATMQRDTARLREELEAQLRGEVQRELDVKLATLAPVETPVHTNGHGHEPPGPPPPSGTDAGMQALLDQIQQSTAIVPGLPATTAPFAPAELHAMQSEETANKVEEPRRRKPRSEAPDDERRRERQALLADDTPLPPSPFNSRNWQRGIKIAITLATVAVIGFFLYGERDVLMDSRQVVRLGATADQRDLAEAIARAWLAERGVPAPQSATNEDGSLHLEGAGAADSVFAVDVLASADDAFYQTNASDIDFLFAGGLSSGDARLVAATPELFDYETVLGLDALAVVVHPAQRIDAIDAGQLTAIAKGDVRDWSDLRAKRGPVTLYLPARETFTGQAIAALFPEWGDAAGTRVEGDAAVLDAVLAQPGAIGIVRVKDAARARILAVGGFGLTPVDPDPARVRLGLYPLAASLSVFRHSGARSETADRFQRFLAGDAVQDLAAARGFIDLRLREVPDNGRVVKGAFADATRGARRLGADLRLRPGASDFDALARGDIERLATYVRSHPGETILLFGFSDAMAAAETEKLASETLARKAAGRLKGLGVDAAAAEGYGTLRAVARDDAAGGRDRNRRVEIWIARR